MDKQTSYVTNPLAVRRPVEVEVKPATAARRLPVAKPRAADPRGTGAAPVEVGLTKFIDFILKTGTTKLTVVKEAKRQNESQYDPMVDFYRILREGVVAFHKKGENKQALDAIMVKIRSKVKLNTYPDFLGGYKKFLGRKSFDWFTPPKAEWSHGGLVVRVNPELGLQLGDSKMAVKMYLRSQGELDKRRAALITHVMQAVLGAKYAGVTMCVLDVKNGKNYPGAAYDAGLAPVLKGEALSFVEMYRSL